MKAMTKKLGAVILALAMCLSLCCTALAADDSYTITVNGYTGQIYAAYKVFDATYNDDGGVTYYIDSDSLWYDQVKDADDVFSLTPVSGTSTYQVTVASEAVTGAQIAAALQPVPEGAEVAALEIVERTGDTSEATTIVLDVTASGAGYYFVTTTTGSAVAVNTATPSVTVDDKNTPPTVIKDVDTVKEESKDNNVTVEYEFQIDNVHGIHNLALEDAMEVTSDKVTYEFDWDTLTVMLVDNGVETPITDSEYTLVKNPEDGCDFHVLFKVWDEATEDWIEYDFDDVSDDAYVYVTIECTLNAEGAEFEDDEYEIPNHAAVTYGNDGHSVWDEADVYEYGFHVFKYTGDIDDNPTALEGAHFTLTNTSEKVAYFEINDAGDYLLEGWADNEASVPSDYVYDLVSDETGSFKIDGLAEGTYTLTETQAPDGYNMLTEPITVTIVADDEDPSDFTVNGNESHQVNVENNAGSELPSTGGIGTTIFYIIGGVLVAGAVVVLITRRRMSHEA